MLKKYGYKNYVNKRQVVLAHIVTYKSTSLFPIIDVHFYLNIVRRAVPASLIPLHISSPPES